MEGNLLILGSMAREYGQLIAPAAPELHIVMAPEYGAAMMEAASEMDFLLAYIIPEELLKAAARLRWIQLMSAGADQVLFSPYLRDDVVVTTARGVHTPQMAEYVLGMMVALARDFSQMVRHQEQRVWKQWPGQTLAGKTVGILGFGAVGQEVARLARAFSMKVLGLTRSGPPAPEGRAGQPLANKKSRGGHPDPDLIGIGMAARRDFRATTAGCPYKGYSGGPAPSSGR